MAAFTQHELVAATAAQQALAAPIEQQHQQLLQQYDGHKKALQPSMAQPSRYGLCIPHVTAHWLGDIAGNLDSTLPCQLVVCMDGFPPPLNGTRLTSRGCQTMF